MKFNNLSNSELNDLRIKIESDPKSKNPDLKSIFKFTNEAQKKLDKIARAITQNMREKRLANGKYIDDSGYSGRQSNK